MTQKQTVDSSSSNNNSTGTIEEEAYKTLKGMDERFKKLEAATSMKRQLIIGAATGAAAAGIGLGVWAIAKAVSGTSVAAPVAAAVPVIPA